MKSIKHIIIALMTLLATPTTARAIWHDSPEPVAAGQYAINTIPADVKWASVHVRASIDGKRAAKWGIKWGDSSVTLCLPTFDYNGDLYPTPTKVIISDATGNDKTLTIEKGISTDRHMNSLKIIYDEGQKARVYAGEDAVIEIGEITPPACDAEVTYFTDSNIKLQCAITAWEQDTKAERHVITLDALKETLTRGNEPVTGVWRYLDRSIDEKKAALDTRYTLAIVEADNDSYIIYEITADSQAKEKGRLHTTIFTRNYDMSWITADGEEYDDDTNAQLSDDGGVLTLRFPALGTQLRFSRMTLR